jgi:hypothetical protein
LAAEVLVVGVAVDSEWDSVAEVLAVDSETETAFSLLVLQHGNVINP